jgi:DNA modification methylase
MSTKKPLWDLKQKQGHPLHRICSYQGNFPPQLPAYFLDRYPKAKTVLDPFCGRGTTILEAVLRGKIAWGVDLLPVARLLSSVKLSCPSRADVLKEIEALDLEGKAPKLPDDFVPFYHPETWRQLWHLREAKRSPIVTALALGKLHGHSPGFFSGFTFNVISVRPESLRRLQKKHGTKSEPRDVKALLTKAAKKFVPEKRIEGEGKILNADARKIPLDAGSVDLVITSPPFLNVIDYEDVNWLREWFIENDAVASKGKGQPTVTGDVAEYRLFLNDVMRELRRLLSKNGRIVFEVGPVKKKLALLDAVKTAAEANGLKIEDVLVNEFTAETGEVSTPKISRAMTRGEQTTTMTNQCVILRK